MLLVGLETLLFARLLHSSKMSTMIDPIK